MAWSMGLLGASSEQAISEYWFSEVDKGSFESNQDVAADSQGNIYFLGTDNDSVNNMVLIKYDNFGNIAWLKEFQTSGRSAYGHSIAVDSNDDLLILGSALDTNPDDLDAIMMKINSSGTIVWQKALTDNVNNYNQFHSNATSVDSSDNFYSLVDTTFTPEPNVSIPDVKIVKLNSSGSLQVQKHIAESNDRAVRGRAISVNSSTGEAYFFGSTATGSFTTARPVILKTNSALSSASWSKEFILPSGYGAEVGGDVDSSGNAYMAWYETDSGTTLYLTKFDSSGNVQWERQSPGSEVFWETVFVAPDGFIYLVGADQNVSDKVVIFKYNSSGVLQWQRSITNTGQAFVYRLSMDSSGELILSFDRGPDNENKFGTARLPADGSLTGTHGGYVYAVGSYTESSSSETWTNANMVLQDTSVESTTLFITNSSIAEITADSFTQTRTDIR